MTKPSHPAVAKVPTLQRSPTSLERVDKDDLSEADRSFLKEREDTIQAGQRTFLDVGRALLEIRNYQSGRLYKRYGTFGVYCQERWEFGRSYACRVMDATEVYLEMLPRGNNGASAPTILPTTEKQIRSLKKLPAPLRLQAWNDAVKAAVGKPVVARMVEKEVRKVMVRENLPIVRSARAKPLTGYKIGIADMAKIQDFVGNITRECQTIPNGNVVLKYVSGLSKLVQTLTGLPVNPERKSPIGSSESPTVKPGSGK